MSLSDGLITTDSMCRLTSPCWCRLRCLRSIDKLRQCVQFRLNLVEDDVFNTSLLFPPTNLSQRLTKSKWIGMFFQYTYFVWRTIYLNEWINKLINDVISHPWNPKVGPRGVHSCFVCAALTITDEGNFCTSLAVGTWRVLAQVIVLCNHCMIGILV